MDFFGSLYPQGGAKKEKEIGIMDMKTVYISEDTQILLDRAKEVLGTLSNDIALERVLTEFLNEYEDKECMANQLQREARI